MELLNIIEDYGGQKVGVFRIDGGVELVSSGRLMLLMRRAIFEQPFIFFVGRRVMSINQRRPTLWCCSITWNPHQDGRPWTGRIELGKPNRNQCVINNGSEIR